MDCGLCYKGKLDRGRHIVRPTVATQKSPAAETFALVVVIKTSQNIDTSCYVAGNSWASNREAKGHIAGMSVISVMPEGKASELEC